MPPCRAYTPACRADAVTAWSASLTLRASPCWRAPTWYAAALRVAGRLPVGLTVAAARAQSSTAVTRLAFSADGASLLCGGADGLIHRVACPSLALLQVLEVRLRAAASALTHRSLSNCRSTAGRLWTLCHSSAPPTMAGPARVRRRCGWPRTADGARRRILSDLCSCVPLQQPVAVDAAAPRGQGARPSSAHRFHQRPRRRGRGPGLRGAKREAQPHLAPLSSVVQDADASLPTVAVFSAVVRSTVMCGVGGQPRILLYDIDLNQVRARREAACARAPCLLTAAARSGPRAWSSMSRWRPSSPRRKSSRSWAAQVRSLPCAPAMSCSVADSEHADGTVLRIPHPTAAGRAGRAGPQQEELAATLHSASVSCLALSPKQGTVVSAAGAQVHLWSCRS